MKTISADKLEQLLNERRGCTFATIHAVTRPKMNKGGNPYFDQIVHLQSRNVTFGGNYASSVNRRWSETDTEDVFIPEFLWKGKGVRINPYMVQHVDNGTKYLAYMLRTNANGVVLPATYDKYLAWESGVEIPVSKLQPYFPAKSPSKKQRVEELDCRETFFRTVEIDGGRLGKFRLGVNSITLGGEQYMVRV